MKIKLPLCIALLISVYSFGQIFDESFDDPIFPLPPLWDFPTANASYTVQNETLVIDAFGTSAEVITPVFDSSPFDSIEIEFVIDSGSALLVEILYYDINTGTDVLAYSTFTNAFGPETINYVIDPPGPLPSMDLITFRFSDFISFQMTLDDILITGHIDAPAPISYVFNGSWVPSDPSGFANAVDTIVISSGDATISSNTTVSSVLVNPGAGLVIDSGATLTTTNGMTLDSSSSSYSSLILNGSVSGDIFYNRHVNINGSGTTGNNDLISAPLTGQVFSDLASTNPNIFNNGTSYLFGPFEKTTGQYLNWAGTETATLIAGIGYRAATSDNSTVIFTGNAVNGIVTNDIENSGPIRQEWNLVGNPYPSYLKVHDFLNHDVGGVTNIQLFDSPTAAIYGYDGNAQNGWTVYNLANTTAATLIAPGQGFFVSANAVNTGPYDLEFTPVMRSTGTSDDFVQGRNTQLTYLKINLSSNGESTRTEFYFNDNATQGLDVGYDAEAFDDINLYSHLLQDNAGKAIALQTLNSADLSEVSIPLGVNANQGEQITFSINESTLPASINVYLDDVVAGTTTLLNSGDYIITPTTNLSGTGRFFLRTSEDALSTIENSLETLNIFALNSTKEIVVSGLLKESANLVLYDIQGRQVLVSELDTTTLDNRINVSSLSGGVYIVTLKNSAQQKTQKVVLK